MGCAAEASGETSSLECLVAARPVRRPAERSSSRRATPEYPIRTPRGRHSCTSLLSDRGSFDAPATPVVVAVAMAPVSDDRVSRPARSLSGHTGAIVRAFVGVLTVAWIVVATIVVVLRYLVLPHADDYRADLERLASRALNETVRIGRIDASWPGLRPVFSLQSLQIVDARGGEALVLPAVRATLSWDSLVVMQLRLASLEIDAPELAIRRDASGQLWVAGFPIRKAASPDNDAAEWLLAQHEVRVRGARIAWRDETTPDDPATASEDLVLTGVDFALERSGWRHRVALRATPPAALAAPLDIRAVIDHPFLARHFANPADWRGEIYANVGTGDVVAWRRWVPLPATMDAGRGRARVWMAFQRAGEMAGVFARRLAERTGRPIPAALDRIAEITADLALDDLAVRWGATEYAALASIDGRIVTSQTMTAQRFDAIRMALQPRIGTLVPPTDFHIARTIGAALDDEAGEASLGAIDIGVSAGLVPDALIPPAVAAKLASLKPRGILDDAKLVWTGPLASPRTFRADARFERLALAPQPPSAEAIRAASREIVEPNGVVRKPRPPVGQPGFENLAGTLKATRAIEAGGAAPVTNVALKIAGNDTTVVAPGLFDEPTLRFAHVNAEVGIRVDGDDVEVRVERGVLDNPDLAGTVAFTFRHGPGSGSWGDGAGRGWIDLDARLSRAEVARVPRYLPTIIGEKARLYLAKSLLGRPGHRGQLPHARGARAAEPSHDAGRARDAESGLGGRRAGRGARRTGGSSCRCGRGQAGRLRRRRVPGAHQGQGRHVPLRSAARSGPGARHRRVVRVGPAVDRVAGLRGPRRRCRVRPGQADRVRPLDAGLRIPAHRRHRRAAGARGPGARAARHRARQRAASGPRPLHQREPGLALDAAVHRDDEGLGLGAVRAGTRPPAHASPRRRGRRQHRTRGQRAGTERGDPAVQAAERAHRLHRSRADDRRADRLVARRPAPRRREDR